ncbi:MAG: hypothetical protein BK997_01085 [Candidatus Micrarchaeum sp. ARMAN-1]|jgi:uncharacterized membrane protein YhdT|nr:MAG: hypothetical protein BK997_01085 [Candidatus Micrarchaeum sp. ARMAN-1]
MQIKELILGIIYIIIWSICLYVAGAVFGDLGYLVFFIGSLLWVTNHVNKQKAEKEKNKNQK